MNLIRTSKNNLLSFILTEKIPFIREDRPHLFYMGIEEAKSIENGLYLEFGVMSGGTTNQIASLILNKTLYGFDSFEGLPEDYTHLHKKGDFRYSLDTTKSILLSNVELVVGWYNDTLSKFLATHTNNIAFMHIDCDVYSSTREVLELCVKQIVKGTVIQFDDIFDVEDDWWYQGEFKAWQEFVDNYKVKFTYLGYCNQHVLIRIDSINYEN